MKSLSACQCVCMLVSVHVCVWYKIGAPKNFIADSLSARPETYWQNSMIINYAVEICLRANAAGGALITL